MKNIFGKDKPEDLTDRDINTKQIVLDKVNILLDRIPHNSEGDQDEN